MAKKKAPAKASKAKPAKKSKPTAAPKASKKAAKPAPKKPAPKKAAPKKPAPKKAAPKKAAPKKAAPMAASTKKTAAKTSPAAKSAQPSKKPAAKGKAAVVVAAPPEKKTYIPNLAKPTGMYGGVLLSEDIKPFPKKTPYSKSELSILRDDLMREKSQLRTELAALEEATYGQGVSNSESHGHSVHIAEHASDLTTTETNLVLRSLDEERLAQVEEAIQRMTETENYGLCLACGDKIGIERLKAKPHAHLCMSCRAKYERERMR